MILRGLDINGVGTGLDGIKIVQAGAVIVENCVIIGSQIAAAVDDDQRAQRTGPRVDQIRRSG